MALPRVTKMVGVEKVRSIEAMKELIIQKSQIATIDIQCH